MKATESRRTPSNVKQTASIIVRVRLLLVDDEESEADVAVVGLDKETVVELGELGVTRLVASAAVVGIEEG